MFDFNEPRTLTGLLLDYRQIFEKFGYNSDSKSTKWIKSILSDEFKEKIGFHNRYHKNKSTIVYDTESGGTYIEAAINSWGISDEQHINNVARRLKEKLEKHEGLVWPPTIEEIETDETPDPILLKFLVWLQNPSSQNIQEGLDPSILTLASLLRSHISGKRSNFKARLSCTIHGMTRSRELVDLLRKLGIVISY